MQETRSEDNGQEMNWREWKICRKLDEKTTRQKRKLKTTKQKIPKLEKRIQKIA